MNVLIVFEAFLVLDLHIQLSNHGGSRVQARLRISGESFGGIYENALDGDTKENFVYDANVLMLKPGRRKIQQHDKNINIKTRKWRKKTFRSCHLSQERKRPFDIVVHIKKIKNNKYYILYCYCYAMYRD